MKTITIYVNGKKKNVSRVDYVNAKTRQLKEFGYADLTGEQVDEQLALIENGKIKDLDVIGRFIEGDLKPRPHPPPLGLPKTRPHPPTTPWRRFSFFIASARTPRPR